MSSKSKREAATAALLSSMVQQWRRGVTEYTYDATDAEAAADQVIYDRDSEIVEREDEEANLHLSIIGTYRFRRDLIRAIQVEINRRRVNT